MIDSLKHIKRLKLFFLVIVVAGVATTSYIVLTSSKYYLHNMKMAVFDSAAVPFLQRHRHIKRNISNSQNILVLYWGFPWNEKSYVPPEGQSDDGCEVTHRQARIAEAHIVIFHFTTISSHDIPWRFYRDPDQIFLWWTAENPAVINSERNENWDAFDNFFNWTWTYRRDSDALRNYGYRANVINGLPRGKKVVDDIIASKKKLAIWFVSRCDYTAGARKRFAFAKELRKAGLNFDGHGKCFPSAPVIPRINGQQKGMAIKEHKFYFSFENTHHCKDYITEKFWENALQQDAVPIVWGPTKEDILSVAPLDSFIFAEDYETPKKLVEYIKFLDEHDDDYRKYFQWREDENMTDAEMIAMTKERYPDLDVQEPPKSLCEVLHENRERKIIKSLKAEFMENNPKECTE